METFLSLSNEIRVIESVKAMPHSSGASPKKRENSSASGSKKELHTPDLHKNLLPEYGIPRSASFSILTRPPSSVTCSPCSVRKLTVHGGTGFAASAMSLNEAACMDMQRKILKAKNEARTVTAIDGCLYIDYKYVGPLPPGVRV